MQLKQGIPTKTQEQILKETVKLLDIFQIHIKSNIRKEYNDLDELMDSIRNMGLLQPITVCKEDNNTYYVLIGHRRFMALQKLCEENKSKYSKIPVFIKHVEDEIDKLEIQIIENEQRNNLKPIELAFALKDLKEKTKQSNESLANRLGKKEKWVRDHLSAVQIITNIMENADAESVPEKLKAIPVTNIVETKGLSPDIQEEILSKNTKRDDIRDCVKQIKKTQQELKIKIGSISRSLPRRTIKNIDKIYKFIEKNLDDDINDVLKLFFENIIE